MLRFYQIVPHVDESGLHNDVISREVPNPHPVQQPVVGVGSHVGGGAQVHTVVPHVDETGLHNDVVSRPLH